MSKYLSYRIPQEIKKVSEHIPGKKSLELNQKRLNCLPFGIGSEKQVYAKAVDGGILVDVDGNQLIDLVGGIAVLTTGGSNEEIKTVISKQANNFTHTAFGIVGYESYLELSEQLNELVSQSFNSNPKTEYRTALFNSGAEAVENAVKIARFYTKRAGVVSLKHAFHGRTNLALSLTDKENPYKKGFGPMSSHVYRAPNSYPFRDNFGSNGIAAATFTINNIESQLNPKDIAALILEPIQGEGGAIVPAAGFIPHLAAWAKQNGILLIDDEIQSGLYRTGKFLAIEFENTQADIICFAKALAAGLPLSAVVAKRDLYDAIPPGGLGSTFGGNPVSCVAALKNLELFQSRSIAERALKLEEIFFKTLEPLKEHFTQIGDLRGRGGLLAIEIVNDSNKTPNPELTKKIINLALDNNVLLNSTGESSNIIRICPPLVIPFELFKTALEIIIKCINEAVERLN